MTPSTFTLAAPARYVNTQTWIEALRAAARKSGAGALSLLRLSAGLNSVDPEQFAHRIVHD